MPTLIKHFRHPANNQDKTNEIKNNMKISGIEWRF